MNHDTVTGTAGPTAVTADVIADEWMGTLFVVDAQSRALIVAPNINGGMFRYATLQTEANSLRRRLEQATIAGLIIDLQSLNYLGAEAIGAVVALARTAEDAGTQAVFCRADSQLQEALTNMGLHRLWPLHPTLEEAIEAVAEQP